MTKASVFVGDGLKGKAPPQSLSSRAESRKWLQLLCRPINSQLISGPWVIIHDNAQPVNKWLKSQRLSRSSSVSVLVLCHAEFGFLVICLCLVFFFFWETLSLCSLDCPGAQCVDQADFELTEIYLPEVKGMHQYAQSTFGFNQSHFLFPNSLWPPN